MAKPNTDVTIHQVFFENCKIGIRTATEPKQQLIRKEAERIVAAWENAQRA